MLQRVATNYGMGLVFYDIDARSVGEATERMLSAVHGGDEKSMKWLESCRVENPTGEELKVTRCRCNGLEGNGESPWYCNGECRCGACDDHLKICSCCGEEIGPNNESGPGDESEHGDEIAWGDEISPADG
jgi:hypothetical protein